MSPEHALQAAAGGFRLGSKALRAVVAQGVTT